MSTLTLRLEAYDKDARQIVSSAQTLADERHNPEVEPVHVLYRLVERDGASAEAIRRTGVTPSDVLVECEAQVRKLGKLPDAVAYLSPRLLDLLTRAEGEAARNGGKPVTSAELLLSCSQETAGPVRDVLRACGLSAPVLRATLAGADATVPSKGESPTGRSAQATTGGDGGDPLEQFGRDLTRMAAAGKFDPAVGRDAELRRILQVLARRRENNPLLVGEPGIGRATIVQALAARIASRDVPKMLEGKRIVALEMSVARRGREAPRRARGADARRARRGDAIRAAK